MSEIVGMSYATFSPIDFIKKRFTRGTPREVVFNKISTSRNPILVDNGIVYKLQTKDIKAKYDEGNMRREWARSLAIKSLAQEDPRLQHILPVKEFGIFRDQNDIYECATFELLHPNEFQTLDDHFKEHIITDEESFSHLRDVLGEIANTIEALHEHGMMHRDIKPENILINSKGEFYIIDFDISTISPNKFKKSYANAKRLIDFLPPSLRKWIHSGTEPSLDPEQESWDMQQVLRGTEGFAKPFMNYHQYTSEASDNYPFVRTVEYLLDLCIDRNNDAFIRSRYEQISRILAEAKVTNLTPTAVIEWLRMAETPSSSDYQGPIRFYYDTLDSPTQELPRNNK